ncbi:UDP-2,3-diacylglucosamine diphosphatase [Hydrogenovibrio sp. 3SP14C1]|uniref:UDP-2,3-diacylglucosamine diphosphatase n=1 Tax=Hydrogenovibrio sp. 3SP14C1 TaxID=3038774 RepID=UPI0024171E50|nr:UDP-2,3-diacylglucosamine diphosphatase [Hydrogenovibrio sp. 3SP14C1]MDG4812373.1 UDP-2,3-diacylglucosamine diphosphatase [Hydrogenovibrio sp. 3SP14C1]
MPYTLFTADIHLHPDDTHPTNQAFYQFLESEVPKAEALYILGDLFEMWVGDDIGIEAYSTVINLFKKLTDNGTPIYLLYGNRDFLMRREFWQASGIQFLKEPTVITLYNQTLLLLHGDALCTDDKAFQRMRKILRNPIIMWLFLRLPKKKRLQIGDSMRRSSQQHTQQKSESIMDVNAQAVEQLMRQHPNCDHLIHGHTHRPAHHPFIVNQQQKHRWVLGDWRPETQVLKLSSTGTFELIEPALI